MDSAEYERRHSFAKDVEAYFRRYPNDWIPAVALMGIGGRMAWRTRIADARKVFEAEGAVLQNRQLRIEGRILSEYRYLTQVPLGRDPGTPMPTIQKSLW